jgi:hypothetical protein
MKTKLDLHSRIPDADAWAHKKLDVCLSCEHMTAENRCGQMNSDCFITAIIQWDWKACPLNKFPYMTSEEIAVEEEYNAKLKAVQQTRKLNYPSIEEFADAWVKDDKEALQLYKERCLEVKQRFPKPTR